MRHLIEAARSKGLDRITIAYAVSAWVVVQAAAIAAPAYAWPQWVLQLIILVALLGLPVVLIGAWAQGIRASTGGALRPARADWHVLATLSVSALVLGGIVLWTFWPRTNHMPVPNERSAVPSEASVAVLPFVNMSGDPRQEYFSDGFSEELINDLANEPHLFVAARTSSFAFKARNENIKTIARELGVRAIVEGSVRSAGDRVRITAQLINASNGYHLWSADYTRNLTDVLSVQDELGRAIAAALTHKLLPGAQRSKIDPTVYRLFLKGVDQVNTLPVPQNYRAGLATFKQVAERAPDFADGFAWLANSADNLAANNDDISPATDWALASDAAQRALSLDPRNMRARAVLGYVALGSWNWRAAAADFRILRAQNPDSIITISGLWNYYALMGFPDEALAQWRHLYAVSPNQYRNDVETLWALGRAAGFQEAIGVAKAQLVHSPRDTFRLDSLCEAYAATDQIDEARAIGERLDRLQTDSDSISDFQDCRFSIDMATGNRADALRIRHIVESRFPDNGIKAEDIGMGHVQLDEFDKASDWFERAYEHRENDLFSVFFLKGSHAFEKGIEKYRMTPGYRALSQKPLFKEWQAEHDRIGAALAAHRDPLN